MQPGDEDLRMLDDIMARCVAGRTLRAARVITRQYDQALSGYGITITQFTLLVVIGRYTPDSIAALAESLNIDRSTLSRNVAKLRKGGFLEKPAAAGRAQSLRLTTKGLEIVQAAYPKWCGVQDGIETKLGVQGLSKVRTSLFDLATA